MIRALLVVLLLVTSAGAEIESRAQLADRCCRKLGLGCPTPMPTIRPTPTPTQDTTGCGSMVWDAKDQTWTSGLRHPPTAVPECFALPVNTSGSVLIVGSQNTSNTQCGQYALTLVDPTGATIRDTSAQPGASMFARAGKWKIYLRTIEPCGQYGLIVRARY